jgi:hypothetical protein
MPRFSRWMKPMAPVPVVSNRALFGVLLIIGALLAYVSLTGAAVFVAILLVLLASSFGYRRYFRRLRVTRPSEDIGTFARAFDRRSPEFDPLVVRAVWDAVQEWLGEPEVVPLRPSDRIAEELHMDTDDLLDEAALTRIAARAGRSLSDVELNPRSRRVETLGDLVALLATQPRIAAA